LPTFVNYGGKKFRKIGRMRKMIIKENKWVEISGFVLKKNSYKILTKFLQNSYKSSVSGFGWDGSP